MLKSTEKKIIRIVKTAIPIAIEADEAFRAKCAISHTSPTLMDEEIHELRVLNAVYRKLKVGSTEIIKNEQFINKIIKLNKKIRLHDNDRDVI